MRLLWIVLGLLGIGLVVLLLNGEEGRLGSDGDTGARMLQLTALALVIGTGALVTRARLPHALGNAALWLAIVVALVGSYQYRYELQDIASRVTAGFVPGSPLTLRTAEGGTQVQLDKSGERHFSARGMVDGRPVLFLVDTGASATVLSARDAAAAGFATADLAFDIPISTANGVASAARITVDDLAVGGIRRGPIRVLVAAPGMLDVSLLGMDFIGSLSGFEVRGDRLTLSD